MQVELAIKKEPEATGSAASAQAATQIHAWTGDDDDDAVQYIEVKDTTIENGDQVEVDGIVVTGHTEDGTLAPFLLPARRSSVARFSWSE